MEINIENTEKNNHIFCFWTLLLYWKLENNWIIGYTPITRNKAKCLYEEIVNNNRPPNKKIFFIDKFCFDLYKYPNMNIKYKI